MSKTKVIITGFIAQYPLGGVAWDYFQYVLGFKNLGYDVYYFEDTGLWPFNPKEGGVAKGCDFNVMYLSQLMDKFAMGNKWSYKFPWEEQYYGLGVEERTEIIENADILINVSGSLVNPANYRSVKKLVYIDSDPVFTQIKLARGQKDFKNYVDYHDVHFSFGESFSELIPKTGHNWIPTRQPVVLSEWENSEEPREIFTTIMNWTSHNDVTFNKESYGQKDSEFKAYIDLPKNVEPIILELAVNKGKTRRTPYDFLKYNKWSVVNPDEVCYDLESYRNYIISSKAEWSVAKNGYVKGQPGWFSCRSACYLAAGRPVVVQETGFSKILPSGEGILSFKTKEEATSAIKEVESNYEKHANAALRIAHEFFDAEKVLKKMINNIEEI